MTMLADRPIVDDAPMPMPRPDRASSATASWRFAGRLARREVRRRPGRTALVMLLVALPVFGLTFASVTARTANGSSSWFERQFGAADVQVADYQGAGFGEALAIGNERLFTDGPSLPGGTTTMTYHETWTQVSGLDADGLTVRPSVHFVVADAGEPLLDGVFRVDRGRLASGPDEVMISGDVADLFGVDVGDVLTLTRPDFAATVVGVHAEAQWVDNSSIVAPGFDTTLLRADRTTVRTLLDLPASITVADTDRLVAALRADDFEAQTPTDLGYFDGTQLGAQQLAWGWVAGVVAFIAVGIVIASAFATSARRQLATVGQLSANGASERLVRRTLGLQGMWTGAFGAVLGIGAGIAVAVAAHRRGLADDLAGYAVGALRVAPLDLVVIALTAVVAATIAAGVPARSAARIPVLSALAGRRPVNAPPQWLVPLGIALFGFGVLLIATAAGTSGGGNFIAAIAVLGVLGVLFGVVCASPLIVAAMSSVGSRRGGVVRLAARSLGRSRMRSAGVLTAVATVSALSVAGLTAVDAVRVADDGYDQIGNDDSVIELTYFFDSYADASYNAFGEVDVDFDPPPVVVPPIPSGLRGQLATILPDAEWYPITMVVFDELAQRDHQFGRAASMTTTVPTIADDVALSLLDLNERQLGQLERTGVLTLSDFVSGDVLVNSRGRLVEINAGAPAGDVDAVSKLPSHFRPDVVITPEFAREQGFETNVNRVIVDNPNDFTDAEREALGSHGSVGGNDSFVGGYESDGLNEWGYFVNTPSFEVPWAVIQLAVLGAALLMVLLVVAIGLSLAATESKDERDVLHTVGAPPRTLRRVAAAKAWVLTTGAAVVAIPTGYSVVRVITWVNDQTAPFPIVGALGLLVVIPAIAWAATLLVSAVAQKLRPVHVATLTLD